VPGSSGESGTETQAVPESKSTAELDGEETDPPALTGVGNNVNTTPQEVTAAKPQRCQEPMFDLADVAVRIDRRPAFAADRLTLHGGASVAVIGPNGAGKTTLLRLLAGLLEPSSGRCMRNCRHVAYVAQQQGRHSWMPLTVGEVLRMGCYRKRGLLGRLDAQDRRAVDEAAERLRIGHLTARTLDALSEGQRRLTMLASALVSDAPCLLLDEPITGLDGPSQRIITETVEAERNRGRLVIITTHHLEEAAVCDRVLVIAGRLIADGTPEEVLNAKTLTAAFGERAIRVAGEAPAAFDGVVVVDDHGHPEQRSGPLAS